MASIDTERIAKLEQKLSRAQSDQAGLKHSIECLYAVLKSSVTMDVAPRVQDAELEEARGRIRELELENASLRGRLSQARACNDRSFTLLGAHVRAPCDHSSVHGADGEHVHVNRRDSAGSPPDSLLGVRDLDNKAITGEGRDGCRVFSADPATGLDEGTPPGKAVSTRDVHILDDEEDLIELFAGPELPKRDPPRAESERRLARVEPNYIHYFEGSTGVSAEESGKTRSAPPPTSRGNDPLERRDSRSTHLRTGDFGEAEDSPERPSPEDFAVVRGVQVVPSPVDSVLPGLRRGETIRREYNLDGVRYRPQSELADTFRTVTITNLAPCLSMKTLLSRACGGAIFLAVFLDTHAFRNSIGSKSALITFQNGHSAAAFAEFTSRKPLEILGRRACVRQLMTPTWPLPQALQTGRYTRCMEISRFPRGVTEQQFLEHLTLIRFFETMIEHTTLNVKKAVMHVRFSSVDGALRAHEMLENIWHYRGAVVNFVRDPCARPLEDQDKQEPKTGSLLAGSRG